MDNKKKAKSLVPSQQLTEALHRMGITHDQILRAEVLFRAGELACLRLDMAMTTEDFAILGDVLGGDHE